MSFLIRYLTFHHRDYNNSFYKFSTYAYWFNSIFKDHIAEKNIFI